MVYEHGVSDFSALPGAIRKASERLVFVAFDLLYLDGFDLRWIRCAASAWRCGIW